MKMKKILSLLLALVLVCTMILPAVAATPKKNALFLGDSIAAGATLQNADEACYGAILANTIGYSYTNDAQSGRTTSALLTRLSNPDVQKLVRKANLISISIGGNDFLLSNILEIVVKAALLNDYTKLDELVARAADNITAIVKKVRTLNPSAVLVLQTVYNPQFGPLRETFQLGLDRLNDALRAIQKKNPKSFTLVDVVKAFGEDKSLIAVDGIHPSAAGQKVIAETILTTLRTLGVTTKKAVAQPEEGIDSSRLRMVVDFAVYIGLQFYDLTLSTLGITERPDWYKTRVTKLAQTFHINVSEFSIISMLTLE
ncbi:MAG: SGNH/GDSL hydrolase family protein [Oscillospiraceae bacterium]|jgi:lysophospholipase L1-like esterase|nr:SGNH/GDSL hydrolase family protein [Oscillospiraceae bacterium]